MGLYYFFKKQTGFVQARLGYLHNNTTGNNWDSSSYNLLLSLLWPITEKLKYNVFLDLTQQPFDNTFYDGATVGNVFGAPLVPQPKRRDQILMFGMQATYELVKGLEAGVHWYFIRDNSNICCITIAVTSPAASWPTGTNGRVPPDFNDRGSLASRPFAPVHADDPGNNGREASPGNRPSTFAGDFSVPDAFRPRGHQDARADILPLPAPPCVPAAPPDIFSPWAWKPIQCWGFR